MRGGGMSGCVFLRVFADTCSLAENAVFQHVAAHGSHGLYTHSEHGGREAAGAAGAAAAAAAAAVTGEREGGGM